MENLVDAAIGTAVGSSRGVICSRMASQYRTDTVTALPFA